MCQGDGSDITKRLPTIEQLFGDIPKYGGFDTKFPRFFTVKAELNLFILPLCAQNETLPIVQIFFQLEIGSDGPSLIEMLTFWTTIQLSMHQC